MKLKKNFRQIIAFLFFLSPDLTNSLLHADTSLSSRELCRRRIAGTFLFHWDEQRKTRELYAGYKEKKIILKKNLDTSNKKLAKIKAKRDQSPFDMQIDDQYENAFAIQKSSELNFESVSRLEVQMKRKLDEYDNKIEIMREQLLTVFKFKDLTGESKGYPFALEYKRKCPRFKSGCPLKLSERKNLEKFFEKSKIPVPEYCKRFLKQGVAYEKVE